MAFAAKSAKVVSTERIGQWVVRRSTLHSALAITKMPLADGEVEVVEEEDGAAAIQ